MLSADVGQLLAAAGYAQLVASATYDRPFPLGSLSPDSFERFSLHFLAALYPNAKVHPAGKSGHKQEGLDLQVIFPDGRVHTFQCKREDQFGPSKVLQAIAVHTHEANKKVILLSRVASPQARAVLRGYGDWDIWDQEDISRFVRSLPKAEQIEVVDIFFRGQRLALLGETEAGPWQTIEKFFAPLLAEGRVFNHRWKLVGRLAELNSLTAALSDKGGIVTMLVGNAGGGKSRVLRHALEAFESTRPGVLVRVLSPTEVVTAKSLEDLGQGEKLLVVDDAHDRDDLPLLMRHAADPENHARLLFSFRPYAIDTVSRDLAAHGLTGMLVRTIALLPPSKNDAMTLAAQVLRALDGPEHAAKQIAEIAFDSPLAVVIGAQLVAKDRMHPQLFGLHEDFRSTVLKRYEKVISEDISSGQDQDRIRRILRVLALIQPVVPDDRPTLELLSKIEGIEPVDASRLTRRLIESGVLFKRGIKHRLSPDLLADSIIASACITSTGNSNDYAEKVFDASIPEHMEHVLLNLGRLDWRRNEGDTSRSSLLDGLWSRLEWNEKYLNPHVGAATAAAYYQPRHALGFAARLIRDGHGDDDGVCRIVRNAAYNLAYVPDACALLWEAGRDDRRAPHQHPDHAIRVLTELATPEPHKPNEFVEAVVDFALSLLPSADNWTGTHTPFDILEGALATEGHFTSAATHRAITLSAYGVARPGIAKARRRIVDELLTSLSHPNCRRAFLAARTLRAAIHGPHGLLNRRPSAEEKSVWQQEFVETFKQLDGVLDRKTVSPTVLVRVAESVSWYAFYGPESDESAVLARGVLARLDRDLHTRTVRSLLDGWGNNTWSLDAVTHERPAHENAMQVLTEDLLQTYPEAVRLAQYLTECMEEIAQTAGSGYGSPHIYLNRLISQHPALAREVIRIRLSNDKAPLAHYGGVALGTLLRHAPDEARARIAELLREGDHHVRLIAQGYIYAEHSTPLADADRAVLKKIFDSSDPSILGYAPQIALVISRQDKLLAIDLLASANPAVAVHAAHEYFMWLAHEDTLPFALIRDDQLQRIVESLRPLARLDDHWINAFLKKVIQRAPHLVLELAKGRMDDAVAKNDWSIQPLDSGHRNSLSLKLLDHPEGPKLLRDLLDWAVLRVGNGQFAFRFGELVDGLCGPYEAAFVAILESWLTRATTPAYFQVAAAVLREAQQDFIYAHGDFVERTLAVARTVEKEAQRALSLAIFAASMSGVRSGTPGEPFMCDLRLKAHAEEKLADMGRFDPAFDLYADLLAHSKDGIERQQREKKLMDEEEEQE